MKNNDNNNNNNKKSAFDGKGEELGRAERGRLLLLQFEGTLFNDY